MNPEVLAIVPARGGSKGIPRKNLVQLAGEPLLVHSIRHALESQRVTRTIVSTDDEEIAEVARKAGAEVPFLRPEELAGDTVLDFPVFHHALTWLEDTEQYRPRIVVHLRPTTPVREPAWIDGAVEALESCPDADSVRSVSQPHQHPYRMFSIDGDGFLEPLMETTHAEPFLLRRQELPEYWYYNCVLDVSRRQTILGQHSMTGEKILPFRMDDADVVDVDGPRDLHIARALLEERR
jgi:CMP-N,N'-diacetyllegionaminic acid synthase